MFTWYLNVNYDMLIYFITVFFLLDESWYLHFRKYYLKRIVVFTCLKFLVVLQTQIFASK
jgi:hypothetical protein